MTDTPDVAGLVAAGALFVANHSGGKDSQAMLIKLLEQVPASQVLVIHATLGEIEWPGALEHAREQAQAAGCEFIVASAAKTFFDMVERRHASRPDAPSFPSSQHRQCTSDLKRDPIAREVRRYMAARGLNLVVSCSGVRAQESASRAKAKTWERNNRESNASRTWYNYLPIHALTTAQVFETIAQAGQSPHWAYAAGNQRLSCMFCIMGSRSDLKNAARHNPALAAKYIELEARTGYTMHMSRKSLTELLS